MTKTVETIQTIQTEAALVQDQLHREESRLALLRARAQQLTERAAADREAATRAWADMTLTAYASARHAALETVAAARATFREGVASGGELGTLYVALFATQAELYSLETEQQSALTTRGTASRPVYEPTPDFLTELRDAINAMTLVDKAVARRQEQRATFIRETEAK